MIVTCVYVKVKPGMVDKFITATRANHSESVREPGNLRFDVIQQADDRNSFMIYEAYESEEAVSEHKKTPHYLKWRDEVEDFMTEPRKGIRYHIIEPNDPSRW